MKRRFAGIRWYRWKRYGGLAFAIVLSAVFIAPAIVALWTGDMRVGKGIYRRTITQTSDPKEFWFRILLYVTCGVAVLLFLLWASDWYSWPSVRGGRQRARKT